MGTNFVVGGTQVCGEQILGGRDFVHVSLYKSVI